MVIWVRKVVQCFWHCLIDHTIKSMENRVAKHYLNYWGFTQKVSEKFSMLPIDHSCDILVTSLKNLTKTKVKNFGLILFSEDISKQSSIESVLWFLVVTLMNIYNEKQQSE